MLVNKNTSHQFLLLCILKEQFVLRFVRDRERVSLHHQRSTFLQPFLRQLRPENRRIWGCEYSVAGSPCAGCTQLGQGASGCCTVRLESPSIIFQTKPQEPGFISLQPKSRVSQDYTHSSLILTLLILHLFSLEQEGMGKGYFKICNYGHSINQN